MQVSAVRVCHDIKLQVKTFVSKSSQVTALLSLTTAVNKYYKDRSKNENKNLLQHIHTLYINYNTYSILVHLYSI